MNSLILTAVSRLVSLLMVVFSIYLLLRGHNEPGGGFVGGLVAASAVALVAMANGATAARRALVVAPQVLVIAGLAIGVTAGVLAAFAAEPFLTGLWHFIGGLPLGTPLLFDIGVYLTVFGSVAMLILALEGDEA
jgi:multicomponent Na+:H+ antiporter subunit B